MVNVIIEYTLVFLVPIFFAFLFNTFFRKDERANMKIVYYKIFTFMLILYIASHVVLYVPEDKPYFSFLGNVLLAIIIFELFLLPDDTNESTDVIMFHQFVLWVVVFILLFNCYKFHFKKLNGDDEWFDIKLYRVDKLAYKISKEFSLYPGEDDTIQQLPLSNIFGYIKFLKKE